MKVADVMTRNVVSVRRDTSFKNTARMLLQHRLSGVPVVDEEGSWS